MSKRSSSSSGSAAPHRAGRPRTRTIAPGYCSAIADLLATRGEARVTDLATLLGVTHVTVTKTIDRLQRDGLVKREPYRSIFLTAPGRAAAHRSRARATRIQAFLERLGVAAAAARLEARVIEPHAGPETLRAMGAWLRKRA